MMVHTLLSECQTQTLLIKTSDKAYEAGPRD